MPFCFLIDQSLTQLSSEKLPPTSNWNKYRDPLTDIIQRINVLGTLSHKRDVSVKFLPLGLRLNTVQEEAENSV